MKPFCKVVMPRVAGALLAVYAAWMFCTHFGLIPVLTSYLPYLILALVLFKGNRDTPLAVVVALVFLARLWVTNITMHLSNALPHWGYVLYPYLIGELLLTAFVLVNTVTKLKKFRLWVNYLWFLPSAAMLACPVALRLLFPDSPLVQTVQTMEAFGCGPFVALAAFLIPLWLVFSAEDDLRTYEEMGSIITPEELEAKRRELGLIRPAGK